MRNQYGESYTAEEKKWARKFFENHNLTETTIAFNKRFGRNKSNAAIHHLCRGVKTFFYTKEMENFLKEQAAIPNNTWLNIANLFNETFKLKKPIKHYALRRKANEMGIQTRNNRQKFEQHRTPKYKIGDEIIRAKKARDEKYIYVKIADTYRGDKACWKKKHYLVWEEHFGEIPQDSFIIFLDGNTLNCDISNLRCVPRAMSICLNGGKAKNSFYGLGEITDTYIEIYKTKQAIKEIKNGI